MSRIVWAVARSDILFGGCCTLPPFAKSNKPAIDSERGSRFLLSVFHFCVLTAVGPPFAYGGRFGIVGA
jgi:hypothetical protein